MFVMQTLSIIIVSFTYSNKTTIKTSSIMKAESIVNGQSESNFSWNTKTEFGYILSQLPVNSTYEGIFYEILNMLEEGLKVTKTALLKRLTTEQRSFINRYSK